MGMLVRLFYFWGKILSSLARSAPTPEPHSTMVCPGRAEFVPEMRLLSPSYAAADPYPRLLAVRIPKALGTTRSAAGALTWPLFVTVTVPVPGGTVDGKIPAICVAAA